MTPDPSEYNKLLNIHINNNPIPAFSNPTILGFTFDPKLKYSTHTDNTITKAKKTQFPKTPHINTLGKKQRNNHHHIQNVTPSHHRIRQHHLVTRHLINLPQQTLKNPKRSLENNHWLHPRHQHPTPPLKDRNSPTPKPSQTSRITTHTKSLPPQSSSTSTHHTKSPPQIQKTIHIQQHQLHPKHALLHPDHLTHTNKKQHENHTHKNSTRLNIIHSQQNPQQATPTHS